ncbi:MAG: MBL fold metallo-hydrolase RNA specificity domain-containing protein [Bacteroidota bacterium]
MGTVNNFLTKTKSGLYCFAGDFYLDPVRSMHRAVVSHAHGDHAVANNGLVYCTAPTKAFMDHRHGLRLFTQFNVVEYGKPFFLNDVCITFYPAGHMLGSAQILMEYAGERYLYTGDFKTQADTSCEAFEYIKCDHLITETTFASPEYEHPDPVKVLEELAAENVNVVIGAYAIGKAQRISKLITEKFPEIPVYVHPEIIPFNDIYSSFGFDLGSWKPYRRTEFKEQERSFYIVSPSQFRRFSRNKNVMKVFATGWKQSYYECDRVLPISDHADWNGLLEMIRQSNPSKIYTVHGDGTFLKQHLSDSKISVEIL